MKQSLIPTAFWYFSIGGGLVLLSYALHKQDPVFIAGQAFGLLVYFRNLYLVYENKRLREEAAAFAAGGASTASVSDTPLNSERAAG